LDAKSNPPSVTSIVFIVILGALIVGIGDLAWHMTMSALSGPG
jgi:hypothetical protein